jgi:segregation and condensation protein B
VRSNRAGQPAEPAASPTRRSPRHDAAQHCRDATRPRIHDDMKTLDAKRVLEAALICSSRPMALRELSALFDGEVGNDTLRALLAELSEECSGRAIELVTVATGWRYQSRPEMAHYLARLDPERPPRYSRAVLETLAIIAYRQPIGRIEIEEIRGVNVGSVLKSLHERGLIDVTGRGEGLGRPLLYGTTPLFLEHFALRHLEELPRGDELAIALRKKERPAGSPEPAAVEAPA